MHDNVIIGLSILTAFTLSIMLALYGMRLLDRDRQWRPRRYGISAREVSCSFCGNLVRSEAILCRHCHHRLDEIPDEQAKAEAQQDGEVDIIGVIQSTDRRLAPVAAAYEIDAEDISFDNVSGPAADIRALETKLPNELPDLYDGAYAAFMDAAERAYLNAAIVVTHGNAAESATRLGLARSTVFKRLAHLGIERRPYTSKTETQAPGLTVNVSSIDKNNTTKPEADGVA